MKDHVKEDCDYKLKDCEELKKSVELNAIEETEENYSEIQHEHNESCLCEICKIWRGEE